MRPEYRICKKCNIEKELQRFAASKQCKWGREWRCNTCKCRAGRASRKGRWAVAPLPAWYALPFFARQFRSHCVICSTPVSLGTANLIYARELVYNMNWHGSYFN